MFRRFLFPILILLSISIAACGSETHTPMLEDTVTETATSLPATPTEVLSTETSQAPTPEKEPTPTEFASECTLVSSLPEAPTEYAELFSLTETEWALGSDTAAITLVEYADFQ